MKQSDKVVSRWESLSRWRGRKVKIISVQDDQTWIGTIQFILFSPEGIEAIELESHVIRWDRITSWEFIQ